MESIVIGVVGILIGMLASYFLWEWKGKLLELQRRAIETRARSVEEAEQSNKSRQQELATRAAKLASDQELFREEVSVKRAEEQTKLNAAWEKIRTGESKLKAEIEALRVRHVTLKDLEAENEILKRDLRNFDIEIRKLLLDRKEQFETQAMLDQKIKDVGNRYLKDTVKWIGTSLNPNNFAICKQRLLDVIGRCCSAGLDIPESQEISLVADLKSDYEKAVRAAFQREEQSRIKAQIREEQMRQKEIDRELKQLEREREAIKAALEKAIAEANDQHSEEVERLKARLEEAEARSQRAISQAQLTKAGHVYVLSNLGSFGDDVFKVGMTRREDPEDRVRELGSASVPFPFDIHMMIACDNAPALENAIHRKLHKSRINKANPRKEFFKTKIETIVEVVKEHHGEVLFTVDAEALQFRQSIVMSDEDEEFIESVFDAIKDDDDIIDDN